MVGIYAYIVTPVICFARIEILQLIFELGLLCLMPLSTIYSVISWWSVLMVEKTGVPGENQCQLIFQYKFQFKQNKL